MKNILNYFFLFQKYFLSLLHMSKLLNLKNPFIHDDDVQYIYIGRRRAGMHYGNPFSAKENSLAKVQAESSEESVEMFRKWINGMDYLEVEPERRKWILEQINNGILDNKILVCYNHKNCCHGDVILELISNRKPNLNNFFSYEWYYKRIYIQKN